MSNLCEKFHWEEGGKHLPDVDSLLSAYLVLAWCMSEVQVGQLRGLPVHGVQHRRLKRRLDAAPLPICCHSVDPVGPYRVSLLILNSTARQNIIILFWS